MPADGRVVGPRGRFGVIIPSTNTVVEQDFTAIRPDGVTFHYGRMYIENPQMGSNEHFTELLEQIRESINVAIRDVVTCKPDALLMGMSAETFWGGIAGNQDFIDRVSERAGGLPVTTGASATRAALDAFGVHKIAVFSPYQPIADQQVGDYFGEAGFDVTAITGLRCATATSIAEVPPGDLDQVIADIDSSDAEAIVQVGTNLSFVDQAVALEQALGKPVIPINVATLWHGLRSAGITDRFEGRGRLLAEQ